VKASDIRPTSQVKQIIQANAEQAAAEEQAAVARDAGAAQREVAQAEKLDRAAA